MGLRSSKTKSPNPDEVEGMPGVDLAHGGDVEVQKPVLGSSIDPSSFLGSASGECITADVNNVDDQEPVLDSPVDTSSFLGSATSGECITAGVTNMDTQESVLVPSSYLGSGECITADVDDQELVLDSPVDTSSFLGNVTSGECITAGVENLALLDIQSILDKPKPAQHCSIPVVFRWDSGGKEVWVCGSFNHWATKIPMTNSHGDFTAIVELPEGRHEYKFFVDGQWLHDPSAEKSENGLGSYNNVMTVTKKDFDEYIETRELTSHEKE